MPQNVDHVRPHRGAKPRGEVGEVSIVSEHRHEMSSDVEIDLHQVRVEVAPEHVPDEEPEREALCERLTGLAEIWARSCIADRHAEIADL